MTYIVNDACIACKYTDCVEVCPVDCFYEGENMLVIDPDVCIDCGVCIPDCPIGAIEEESDELSKFIMLARKYTPKWPVITKEKPPMKDADVYKDVENKFEKHFSDKPGKGDL